MSVFASGSYLGVFATHDVSLDRRLEHSDEIQSLVLQLLRLVRLNLQFGKCLGMHPNVHPLKNFLSSCFR